MNSRTASIVALLFLALSPGAAWPAPPLAKDQVASAPGKLPVTIDGRSLNLEILVVRPKAEGRYPLALITHGTPRNPDAGVIRNVSIMGYGFQAEDFARRGYVAVAVMRRGYGASEGSFADAMGSCNSTNYPGAAGEAAKDLVAAIEALKSRADVDPQRIVAMGESAGGFGVLALSASPPAGLRAVINFAGGRGSSGPNFVCQEHELERTFGEMGKGSRIPSLWIYAENDSFFGPALARRLHASFTAGGAKADFLGTPAFGREGHVLFMSKSGRAHWWGPVDAFLARTGLPTWDAAPNEPFALDAPPPAVLGGSGRVAWASYLAGSDNRAFAVAPNGRFGWRLGRKTLEEAKADAIKFCAHADCRVVAENDRLIP